jgi:hypothetical protein
MVQPLPMKDDLRRTLALTRQTMVFCLAPGRWQLGALFSAPVQPNKVNRQDAILPAPGMTGPQDIPGKGTPNTPMPGNHWNRIGRGNKRQCVIELLATLAVGLPGHGLSSRLLFAFHP